MAEVKQVIRLLYSSDEGCRFQRILSPARFLKHDLAGVKFVASARGDEFDSDAAAYVVHGLPVPETITIMAKRQLRGAKFIWSVDDDFLSVPPWNPCHISEDKLSVWHVARRQADAILVSTPGIARTFDRFPERDKVFVAPNLIDTSLYPTPVPASPPGVDRPLTILWAGSNTHLYDVAPIEMMVRHVLGRYRGKIPVEFIFFGQAPPESLLTEFLHKGVTWVRPVDLGQFWGVMSAIRPHVTLAPLHNCTFNLSKSNIRVLDGWALCSAVVATPFGEYSIVEDGVDGLHAKDESGWVDAVERLVEDGNYRQQLAVAGRKRCELEFGWDRWENRSSWRDAFVSILGSESRQPSPQPVAVCP